MDKIKPYYSMAVNDTTAEIVIYGDITSWPWLASDVSAYLLSRKPSELDPAVTQVNVFINSYGGEVSEGLAIYNALRRHPAQVTTYCDGFACSAASVIFMAGDRRVMNHSSLLMIHNAWSSASGNAQAMRKAADDLDIITGASVNAYLDNCGGKVDQDTLLEMMDNETWLTPEQAVAYGFATEIDGAQTSVTAPSQSVRATVIQRMTAKPQAAAVPPKPDTPKETPFARVFSAVLDRGNCESRSK